MDIKEILNNPKIKDKISNEITRFNAEEQQLYQFERDLKAGIPVKKEDMDNILIDFMNLSTKNKAIAMQIPPAKRMLMQFANALDNTIKNVRNDLETNYKLENGYYKK